VQRFHIREFVVIFERKRTINLTEMRENGNDDQGEDDGIG